MLQIPIFYINLASRPDRRAFMEEQFERLGLKAQRIEAVASADLPESLHSEFRLRKDQTACVLSHEKAWRMLAESGDGRALILEDDAMLSPALPQFLDGIRADDAGLIRIETTARPSRLLPLTREVVSGIGIRPSRSSELGSAGYIMTVAAASVMLSSHDVTRRYPVDIALFCPFLAPGRLLGHSVADPALCRQLTAEDVADISRSDIRGTAAWAAAVWPEQNRRLHALSEWAKIDIPRTLDHVRNIPKGIKKKTLTFLQA